MSAPAKTEALTVGPFTWKREDDDRAECWNLVTPAHANFTFFCLKNYGGQPHDYNAFSGWRLVSGGPFTDAGGWESRSQAMAGVVSYLIAYYQGEARTKMRELKRQRAAINKFISLAKGPLK